MACYECRVCGFVYGEDREGRVWNDLPEDWNCPTCGSQKSKFSNTETPKKPLFSVRISRTLPLQHRIFGYAYLIMYILFMWRMVPRLWEYQIEFPARTVVHMSIGMTLGAILFLKIATVRFFRRMNPILVTLFGTWLFLGTVVLIGISAPFALREAVVSSIQAAEGLFDAKNLQRVQKLLSEVEFEDESKCRSLSSAKSLRAGREILRRDCIRCHDLRTVLARTRTPKEWLQTVQQMADLTTTVDPIDKEEQCQVTAYLIAISPQLQKFKQEQIAESQVENEMPHSAASEDALADQSTYNPIEAKDLFESKCSECHNASRIEKFPPKSVEGTRSLLARMINQGLVATPDELTLLEQYIVDIFLKKPNQ